MIIFSLLWRIAYQEGKDLLWGESVEQFLLCVVPYAKMAMRRVGAESPISYPHLVGKYSPPTPHSPRLDSMKRITLFDTFDLIA